MWPFNGSVESRNLPSSVCSDSFLPLHFIVSPILFPLFCSFCHLFWPSSLFVVYHFHFLLFCVSVRPVLEYSSTAWSTTAKTNQQSLDNIQNQALRIIYRRNEVHTHHIRGANHCYTTSTIETTSKSPSSSREIQVPPRSSHEGEGRGPYQEHNKEKQFHR